MFRFKKSSGKKGPQGIGFYIALAVCLVAIGASAWTTLDSILSLKDPVTASSAEGGTQKGVSSVTAVNRPVSGVPADTSSAASSEPVSSRPAESSGSSAAPANHPVTQASSVPEAVSSAPPSSTPPVTSNTFIMPINGRILKPYSESAYSRTFCDWRAHYGVDIAAVKGANVLAIGDGTVTKFEQDNMLGGVLVIEHSGLEVYYCGLGTNPSVKAGDAVICGQILGVVGDVPSETVEETHLHLQVKKGGEWVEPLAAIGKEDKLPSEAD